MWRGLLPTGEVLSAGEVCDFLEAGGASGFDLCFSAFAAEAGLFLVWGFGFA